MATTDEVSEIVFLTMRLPVAYEQEDCSFPRPVSDGKPPMSCGPAPVRAEQTPSPPAGFSRAGADLPVRAGAGSVTVFTFSIGC